MSNTSGSALAKLSFVLLLFIASGVGYLLVRIRPHQEQSPVGESTIEGTLLSDEKSETVADGPSALVEPKYAPLRPRAVTNVLRASSNRLATAVPNSSNPVGALEPKVAGAKPTSAVIAPADFGALAGADAVASKGVSVKGRALLQGTPPSEKAIKLDPACGRLQSAPITTRHYVVGPEGELANVFVYIKAGAPVNPASGPGPLLDQVGCEYQPYVMGVQTGQTLSVRNSDALLHNVHSLPKVPGNKERNIGQPVKNMVTSFVFTQSEVLIQFKCDVHPWMFAYVGVVDHPWFAVTDKGGNFTLPGGLPPGRYTLAAVHLKAGELLQQIEIHADEATPVNFTFNLPESLTTQARP